jgi:hypothetical protein
MKIVAAIMGLFHSPCHRWRGTDPVFLDAGVRECRLSRPGIRQWGLERRYRCDMTGMWFTLIFLYFN